MSTTQKPTKPLGRRAYGSIPHLPGSRRGPADRGLEPAQAALLTDAVRDRHDEVIVQEKLDGSNVAVCRTDAGELVAINRAGWPCWSSPHKQHHDFAEWVLARHRYFDFLNERCWVSGEWLGMAHGTRYDTEHDGWQPFVAFDYWFYGTRVCHDVFMRWAGEFLQVPRLLHRGGACPLDTALARLGRNGWHGAKDRAEGVVYRMERKGRVEFLGKYVRPEKVDGKYFPEMTGGDPIWHWRPEAMA